MSAKKNRKRFSQTKLGSSINDELREHKSSFIVFNILRIIVLIIMVRQFFLANYESVFFCLLTLIMFYVPSWIQAKTNIALPPALEITIFLFIFAAEILGEINAFYVRIHGWDTMLHTLNGFLAAAVGFSLVVILNNNDKLAFELSPFFMALMAFCFSMTVAVLWEFFEFSMDYLFFTDMQKDTVINAIHSVALDATNSNKVESVMGISEVYINDEPLGVGGYLDIGLLDTMKDMFVNFIGAAVFSVCGFFYTKSKGYKRTIAQNFVPTRKANNSDKTLPNK